MQEIKSSLSFMSEEINKVVKQQENLMSLVEEVRELKAQINKRDQRIELLEQRIDDVEQHSRANDLIITGLDTKHCSYARATAGVQQGEDAPPEELHILEQQVAQFLSRKDMKTKPTIVVQFANRKPKIALLRQSKKLKGTGVYVNEHLTKKNAEMARNGRVLRQQNKIQATWTRNGTVFIKSNGPPEHAKVVVVRNMRDLDQ